MLTIAYNYLAVMGATLIILYLLHIYRSALQGMGDTLIPMCSGIAELVMRILIALLLPLIIGKRASILPKQVPGWAHGDPHRCVQKADTAV